MVQYTRHESWKDITSGRSVQELGGNWREAIGKED